MISRLYHCYQVDSSTVIVIILCLLCVKNIKLACDNLC